MLFLSRILGLGSHQLGQVLRIVLDGLPGESSIAELCRKEGINPNLYCRWGKDFLEAGKKRLSGDTVREANSDEVTGLKRENSDLKQAAKSEYALIRETNENSGWPELMHSAAYQGAPATINA